MSLSPLPATPEIVPGQRMTAIWQVWFNSVQQWLGPQAGFGATTARPTSKLYVGLSFYDTTLGKPVFVHQVAPPVWHDAAGNVV